MRIRREIDRRPEADGSEPLRGRARCGGWGGAAVVEALGDRAPTNLALLYEGKASAWRGPRPSGPVAGP